MKFAIALVAAAALAPFAASAAVVAPRSAKPQVTMQQARIAALKLRPGTVRKSELERERGGSGLRYSFDIEVKGKVYEVGIDAVSGRVLENGKA